MVLLLWFFMASLLFSSLVILLRIPSKYKPRSNCPAPRGILERRQNKSRGDVTTAKAFLSYRHSRTQSGVVKVNWGVIITSDYSNKAKSLCFPGEDNIRKWDSLVSAWPELDMKDPNDRPMVRRLHAGATGVLDHFDVISLSALEQDSVLWTQNSRLSPAELSRCSWKRWEEEQVPSMCWICWLLTVYEGVLCLEVVS